MLKVFLLRSHLTQNKLLERTGRWYLLFVMVDFCNVRVEIWVFVEVIGDRVTEVLDPPIRGLAEFVDLEKCR
jgi:hypothetical protein